MIPSRKITESKTRPRFLDSRLVQHHRLETLALELICCVSPTDLFVPHLVTPDEPVHDATSKRLNRPAERYKDANDPRGEMAVAECGDGRYES